VLKALGASKFDILWNVGLPRTMPFFFRVAESRGQLRLCRRSAVRDRRVEQRIGNVLMTAIVEFQRTAGVRRSVRARGAWRRPLRDLSLIEGRVTGWATRKN